MRKLFIILAMFISASLMFASCKSSAEENSVPAHESSAPSEESSAEEAADSVLLGDVAQIDASGIYFVTVSYHNIGGRKSYRLSVQKRRNSPRALRRCSLRRSRK